MPAARPSTNGIPVNESHAPDDESPAIRGFAQSNGVEPRPPKPPSVAQTLPQVRREVPRPPAGQCERGFGQADGPGHALKGAVQVQGRTTLVFEGEGAQEQTS